MAQTIEPTPAMRAAVVSLIKEGRISASAYQHAVANGYSAETLVELAEKQRAIKKRMALEARESTAPANVNPNDPTPQWLAKAGASLQSHAVGRGDVVPVRSFRTRSLVEQYADKFSELMLEALVRFMQDSDYHERIRGADWNSSGGGSTGDRLGGLGNVPQHVRDGHARHSWVYNRLSPGLRITARALASRVLTKGDGSPFSMEDFGAHIMPNVIDRNRRWGVAAGALWSLGSMLLFLYQQCPLEVRPVDESERELDAIGDR